MRKRSRALMGLGTRIREARLGQGLSQEELALKCGLDRTYIGGVERGERNLGVLNLLRVSEALNVPASSLLVGLKCDS
jgi:transcriptional regulator with XRE-family HTH domain